MSRLTDVYEALAVPVEGEAPYLCQYRIGGGVLHTSTVQGIAYMHAAGQSFDGWLTIIQNAGTRQIQLHGDGEIREFIEGNLPKSLAIACEAYNKESSDASH